LAFFFHQLTLEVSRRWLQDEDAVSCLECSYERDLDRSCGVLQPPNTRQLLCSEVGPSNFGVDLLVIF